MNYKTIDSPLGKLKLVSRDKGLAAILWENDPPGRVRLGALKEDNNDPVLVETEKQLKEYFAGERTRFSVPLNPAGTVFQNKVWQALTQIPYGETKSYREVAEKIGHASAVRAVGAANGRNPISIVVPCHRVIGSSGKLTGFAGGLGAKEMLLTLEGQRSGAGRKWKV